MSVIVEFFRTRSLGGWGALIGLLCATIFLSMLAWEFYGHQGGGVMSYAGLFCVWAVPVILTCAGEMARRKTDFCLRWAARGVAIIFIAFNLIADFGAVAARRDVDTAAREKAYATYEANLAIAGTPEKPGTHDARINALAKQLDDEKLPRVSATIKEMANSQKAKIEAHPTRYNGRTAPPAYSVELNRLLTAYGWSLEYERLTNTKASAVEAVKTAGTEPEQHNPQVTAIQTILSVIGIKSEPRLIDAALALSMAIVLHLAVIILSMLAPALVRETDPMETLSPPQERADEPPLAQVPRTPLRVVDENYQPTPRRQPTPAAPKPRAPAAAQRRKPAFDWD